MVLVLPVVVENYDVLKITTSAIRENTRGVKVGRWEVQIGISKKGWHDLYLKKKINYRTITNNNRI